MCVLREWNRIRGSEPSPGSLSVGNNNKENKTEVFSFPIQMKTENFLKQ